MNYSSASRNRRRPRRGRAPHFPEMPRIFRSLGCAGTSPDSVAVRTSSSDACPTTCHPTGWRKSSSSRRAASRRTSPFRSASAPMRSAPSRPEWSAAPATGRRRRSIGYAPSATSSQTRSTARAGRRGTAQQRRRAHRLKEQLEAETFHLREELRGDHDFTEIVGKSAVLHRALDMVSQVATADSSVLLLGETGTGKEPLARAIHARPPTANSSTPWRRGTFAKTSTIG